MSSSDMSGMELARQDANWLLGSFCTLHHLAFDPGLFAQRYPPPLEIRSLTLAAHELGLRIEHFERGLDWVLARRMPVAVLLENKEETSAPVWALVLNVQEERVVVLPKGAASPSIIEMVELKARYLKRALAAMPVAAEAADPDSIDLRSAKFGLRWFVPELLKHRIVWREILAASLAMQLMGLALPLFTQVIIDKVVVHRTSSTLVAIAVAMGIFMIFTGILTWLRQYLVLHTGQRIDAVLGSNVFDRLFRLPLLYFHHRPTGVIAARLHGIENIRQFIASAAVTLVLDLPFLLIFVGIMFWYSVSLTLLVLAILGLVAAMSAVVAPLFRGRLNEQFRRGAATQAFLTEYVAGIETVKSLQFEPQLNQKYRGLFASYLEAGFATSQLANTYNAWANTLEQLMTILVLMIGAWLVMNGTGLTIGMLVAFQMFATRISSPMLRMVGLWQQWQQTRISISRIGDIMNAPPEPYSLVPRRSTSAGPGAIELEGLAFRYDAHLPFLYEGLGFTLKAGQLVTLMGPSGSGKSTLAKLLQGFYAPTRGRIRVDGVDIGHLSANELRAVFGVVPQETVLFSGTILDNLKLANPYASFDQVVAACKMAEIHAAIEALPAGYQTAIGERGVGLSGGQRQRVSIARALLKGPRVLIFDEATSSVDALTAEQLARTVNGLKGRVTILFIAHLVPKSLQADQTVRLGEKLTVVAPERVEAGVPS
jgi:subfamily B ATP-binding cassette protein HlyB/CyaB